MVILTGMQDYNYMETNCFEITLELECDKFPPAEKLTQLWWDNIDALFNFMFQVTDKVDFFTLNSTEHNIYTAHIILY